MGRASAESNNPSEYQNLVGKGKFVEHLHPKEENQKQFVLGCDSRVSLPTGAFDHRIKPGMSVIEYFMQESAIGHRAIVLDTSVVNSKFHKTTRQNELRLVQKVSFRKGFDGRPPNLKSHLSDFPVGSKTVIKCTEEFCQSTSNIDSTSILDEVGHSDKRGRSCGPMGSPQLTTNLQMGHYTFHGNGNTIEAFREVSKSKFDIYCGTEKMEPGEQILEEIRTNSLPSVAHPFSYCGGVVVQSIVTLKGLKTGKVYWTHYSEILMQN
jgi:hypothetical protein